MREHAQFKPRVVAHLFRIFRKVLLEEAAAIDGAPEAPDQPPSPAVAPPAAPEETMQAPEPAAWHAAPLLAAAPMPQSSPGDPLAALKAMSDDELIALFS